MITVVAVVAAAGNCGCRCLHIIFIFKMAKDGILMSPLSPEIFSSFFFGFPFPLHIFFCSMPVESKYQKQQAQPRDARIVSLILQSLGVDNYDPRVVPQLLEFAHRKK